MEFAPFHAPYAGDGMVIGINGIIHVWISHGIAIGAFLMLVLADWADQATFGRHASAWNAFHGRLLKFTVIMVTIVGAVTGAGIWFTTGALAPRGVASMLRIFFWPWFIEWWVFVAEVIVLLVLYFYWHRLAQRRRLRLAIALGYLALAGVSAVLITGILGFMLTPQEWPVDRQFTEAFFNPSFLPQLFARLSLAVLIGALVGLAFALFPQQPPGFQGDALRLFGIVLAGATAAFVAGVGWQHTVLPQAYTTRSVYAVITSNLTQSPWVFYAVNAAGLMVLALLAWGALQRKIAWSRWLVFPAILVSVGLAAEFERIREFIRGPFLMPGYMYVSGVLLQETPYFQKTGMLPHSYWYQTRFPNGDVYSAGAQLFAQNCSACHTLTGVNDIRARLIGRSEDGIFLLLGHTHDMVSFMPPVSANARERRAMARFLYQWTNRQVRMSSLARAFPVPGDDPDD